MTDQLSLSTVDAEAARAFGEGLAFGADRVQVWKTDAAFWLRGRLPGDEFTADDLVTAIGLPDRGPGRNNVVGAWFSAQSKAGRIEWTGRFAKSARVIGHRNLQRVWRRP